MALISKKTAEQRRKQLKQSMVNALVMLCALAGVMLADPWQMYRNGEVPVFISPNNFLELIFSVVLAFGIVAGVQEFGGDAAGKHKRAVKRCVMAFVAGAGGRVMVG